MDALTILIATGVVLGLLLLGALVLGFCRVAAPHGTIDQLLDDEAQKEYLRNHKK